ncbi:MAG: hypothetical protein WCA11_10955 [Terracidiphilus sp.]
MAHPVRGTQELVDQMGWTFSRPLLTLVEVAWRWLFGIPFLVVCWRQIQQIAASVPAESTGINNLDTQNPWVAVVQLGNVWTHYQPHVVMVLHWLAPSAALVWIVLSGFGRGLVVTRVERGVRFRPIAMMVFQAGWLALLVVTLSVWYRTIQWVAATHIAPNGDADLVGYSIWAIFLSLGFFSLWAVVSWPFTIAPLLVLFENRSPGSALVESFKLGKAFTSKLMEINLVMGIVKLMLIVLAMVFSAAPLPFSDQLGPGALRVVAAASVVFYLVSSDYFQVVRLKSFIEFWRTFRGQPAH